MRELTLGSLFSGSGGFELAGSIFGIKPVWESEIEPFPMRVTERNFPDCLKLGNITEIHGWAIPKVDIITGGSPCQDMSIAGKRDGLGGERSCLFNEQIRIVKEMREDDRNAGRTGKDIRCRWMCWENVPGAFTSNQKKDFQAVLTEIIRIAEPQAPPVPIPQGGWPYAGALVDEHGRWSVAYRTLDAKFWGVPQRRSRIYLVADFAGTSGPEILFDREGLSRHFAESRQAWEADHPHPAPCSGAASGNPNRGGYDGLTFCLQGSMIGRSDKNGPQGAGIKVDESFTLDTIDRHAVAYGINRQMFNAGESVKLGFEPQKELSPTIIGTGPNAVMHPLTIPEISGTLTAKMAKGTGGSAGDEMQNLVAEYPDYIVRRFTPLECGRLQGFPDWWTEDLGIEEPSTGQIERWVEIFKTHWSLITSKDGVKAPKTRSRVIKWLKNPTSDSSLYKMWGNGLALPCAMFVLEGIAEYAEKEVTQ